MSDSNVHIDHEDARAVAKAAVNAFAYTLLYALDNRIAERNLDETGPVIETLRDFRKLLAETIKEY